MKGPQTRSQGPSRASQPVGQARAQEVIEVRTGPAITGARDAAKLYDVLEREVIPPFHERDSDGLPRTWIKMMKNSIASLA